MNFIVVLSCLSLRRISMNLPIFLQLTTASTTLFHTFTLISICYHTISNNQEIIHPKQQIIFNNSQVSTVLVFDFINQLINYASQ